jgi:hypothetical protein
MTFDGTHRYTSFVNGTSFPTMGQRDHYDATKRSQEATRRSQEAMRRSQESARQSQDFIRSMNRHASQARYSYSSPRRSFPAQIGGGVTALSVVMRIAVLAVVLVYALPHLLRPTPAAILTARQFVTASVESAAAELAPPDVARSINTFIDAISR